MGFDRRIQLVAQWLAVLAPLLLLAGPAPQDIGASVVAVLFLVHSAVTRDWEWLNRRWMQVALLIWLAMSLRNILGGLAMEPVGRALVWIRYPLFAMALSHWLLRDDATRKRLWHALAIAVTLLVLDCFWQYHHGFDVTGRASQYLYDGAVRLTGPFSNPRVGITIAWLLFPLVLPLLATRHRWGALLLAGAALAIYLSGERMALLLFAAGVGVMFLAHPASRKFCAVAAIAVALAGTLLSIKDPLLVTRQFAHTRLEIARFGSSTYGQTWSAALHIWQAHPAVGVGSKQFSKECAKPAYGPTDKRSIAARCPMHAHNIYLEWLVEFGLLGFALFLWLIASWTRLAWWPMAPLPLGLAITLGIHLWPISVAPSQFVPWAAVPFWLMLGWWLALRPEARDEG